jgi:hypothetical protein
MSQAQTKQEVVDLKPNITQNVDDVLSDAMSVNLSQVIPPVVDVDVMEYVPDPEDPERFVLKTRTAHINCYVPMRIFHQMLASRQKMLESLRQEEAGVGAGEGANQSDMMAWMTEQVLQVWKLTERNMTLERLETGLTFDVIFGLFTRFFGDLIKRWQAKGKLMRVN